MKIKMFLFLVLTVLFVFLINLSNQDKEIYYLNIDTTNSLSYNKEIYHKLKNNNKLEKYINIFSKKDYRTTDLINDINNNKEVEETNKTIKNALIKSDLITLSIGTNDIISKINTEKALTKIDYNRLYKNIDEIINDLDKLLKLIREYCKEDIILIGINIQTEDEKLNEIINYANEKFKEISEKYKIYYIDYLKKEQNKYKIYPTKEEYKQISEQIIYTINSNY